MNTDADIIFAHWKDHGLEGFGKSRFTKLVTKDLLDTLMNAFKEKGIDKDTVLSFERKAVEFLITEDGLRGGKNKKTGRDYKDWVKNVKDYYKAAIGDYYMDSIVPKPDIVSNVLSENKLLRKWVKYKFGSESEAIINSVALTSNSLNLLMQEEILNSSWALTGENIPDWAK